MAPNTVEVRVLAPWQVEASPGSVHARWEQHCNSLARVRTTLPPRGSLQAKWLVKFEVLITTHLAGEFTLFFNGRLHSSQRRQVHTTPIIVLVTHTSLC